MKKRLESEFFFTIPVFHGRDDLNPEFKLRYSKVACWQATSMQGRLPG